MFRSQTYGNIEIENIPEKIRIYYEQMKKFDEKVDRRTVLSLYEIKLVDVLTGKAYEVEYGKTVSVTIPSVDLFGYKNIVVVEVNLDHFAYYTFDPGTLSYYYLDYLG